jgi:outer membrane lipoprotein SlyB
MIRNLAFGAALLLAATGFQAQAQEGGLVGGLLGAGAGAIIGGAATGKAGGAAAGAIIGGATGAIIGSAAERDRYRSRNQGFYYNSRGRCYYEYPNGDVVKVANHSC